MISITDVAKAAGVSTATVSRVLHNSDAVKPATRDQVLAVIDQMNYKPNALARQMRTQKTKTVIVIVPDLGNTFFSEILYGIETCATKHGYQILIANMHNQPSIEKYYFKAVQEHSVDGVISLSASVAKRLMEQVAKEHPIVVACQYLESDNIPNVTIDNISAAESITNHLIQLGHRKIAHIAGPPTIPLYKDRLNGYISALTKNNIPIAAESITNHLIQLGHRKIAHIAGPPTIPLYKDRLNGYISALTKNNIPIDLEMVSFGESSIQHGYDGMKNLLESGKSFSAVFTAGDIMAVGAIKAIKDAGLRVPQDCAVVGFDDIEISAFCDPPLTTVRQPRYQIGETAFKMLLKLMNKTHLNDPQVVLDYDIVIRESCGYHPKKE